MSIATVVSSALFQQIAEATRGEYVLDAELGHSETLGNAFLGREAGSGRSVVLVVPPGAEALDVVGALGDTIPADAGGCAACGFRVGTWVDACPRCEHSLLPPPGSSPDAAVLAEQLRDSVDVLGSLPHLRGGTVYFGRELSDGRLSAFVVRPQDDAQLALDVVWEEAGPAGHPEAVAIPERLDRAPDAWEVNGTGVQDGAFAPPAEPSRDDDGGARNSDVGDGGGSRGGGRRWLPVGLGVGALALVAAAGFALTRHPAAAAPTVTPRDSAPTIGLNGPFPTDSHPAQATQPVQPSVQHTANTERALTTADSLNMGLRQPTPVERAYMDSVRRYKDSVRTARRLAATAAVLTLDGDLPSGWTAAVEGGGSVSGKEIRVPANTPVVVRLQAPGYCTDTLRVQLPPGGRRSWSPVLRGSSIVEQC